MADNDIVIGGQQPKKVEALRPGEERLRLELKLATAETENSGPKTIVFGSWRGISTPFLNTPLTLSMSKMLN